MTGRSGRGGANLWVRDRGGPYPLVSEGGRVRKRGGRWSSGEGLLQHKADAPEVKVFGEAGGVTGPWGEAVGVRGSAAEGQVSLAGGRGIGGGARLAVIVFDGGKDGRKASL